MLNIAPKAGSEGWPRGRLFISHFADVRGLYAWAAKELAHFLTPSLVLYAVNFSQRIARGLPLSLSSGRYLVIVMIALQLVVRGVTSLIALPAQKETLLWFEWLSTLKWAPEGIREFLRHVLKSLKERESLVNIAKIELSERHRSNGSSAIEPVRLVTPDGVHLQAWWAPARSPALAGGPRALVYFCGNGECAEVRRLSPSTYSPLSFFATSAPLTPPPPNYFSKTTMCPQPPGANFAARWRAAGFGVLAFNYRGVSTSSGSSSRHGLILDAITALNFLTAPSNLGGEGLPPHAVALLGHSLGGGVAPEAASFFPGVTVISDRSFSRLSDAACAMMARLSPRVHAPLRFLMARLACWELDAARYWRSLPPECAKLLVYAPGDQVIKTEAQLVVGLAGRGYLPCTPPQSAAEAAAIVGTVMEMEAGADHNREFTAAELHRVVKLLDAAMVPPRVGSVGGVWRPVLPQKI
jgi:hypothetical protein